MSATIEVIRTHSAAGKPAPSRVSHAVTAATRGQTMPDAVRSVIRPLRPSRSETPGVYPFDSPEHGRGRIVVTLQGALARERMDEQVLMLEIERALGSREPARTADIPAWQYPITLHVRNPYLQIGYGVIFMVPGLLIAGSVLFVRDTGALQGSLFFVLALLLIAGGFFQLLWPGTRRIAWWHAARREVRRRGVKMPADLALI
ncbi:hypothetical protein [Leucobacter sp. M11]|uniref:hypothetical protein n=1 Tax=Leucobacter sp. M11 TaxID=2993565 RepID=UPI002D7F6A4F|nr:hypothetical protein [Leucobacter sp. M11]MEB4613082.1 hypothetical protein [Leucobacter sp. M11]